MLIKLGIIAAVLILGGMIFSTEITTLFPSTSALLADSLKDDINVLNEKVTNSAENRLDTSIDKTIQSVSDSVYQGITKTGDNITTEIIESSESSKEILTNKISDFDPFSFIKNIFKTN